MAPPVVIAPVVAALVFFLGTLSWVIPVTAAVVSVITVMLLGWPLIFWMVDNGRRSATTRTVAGALFGLAPFVAALLAGVVGLYIKSNDIEYVQWALGHGASVPYYGLVLWPRFAWLTALGVMSGIATFWLSKVLQKAT